MKIDETGILARRGSAQSTRSLFLIFEQLSLVPGHKVTWKVQHDRLLAYWIAASSCAFARPILCFVFWNELLQACVRVPSWEIRYPCSLLSSLSCSLWTLYLQCSLSSSLSCSFVLDLWQQYQSFIWNGMMLFQRTYPVAPRVYNQRTPGLQFQ